MLRIGCVLSFVVIVAAVGTITTSAFAKAVICTKHTLAVHEFETLSTCWVGTPEVLFGRWKRRTLGATEKAEVTSQGGPFTVSGTVAGIKVEVTCIKETDTGELFGTEPTTGTTSIEFSSCKGGGCAVKEPVKIEKAKAEVVAEGEKLFDKISPASGTVLATVVLKGCVVEGTYELIGTARAALGLEESTFGTSTGSKLELRSGIITGVATLVGKVSEKMALEKGEEAEETRFEIEQ